MYEPRLPFSLRRYPFEVENNNEVALMRKIARGQFKPIQGPYTTSLLQIVSSLLAFKADQRPDAAAMLRNPTLVAKASKTAGRATAGACCRGGTHGPGPATGGLAGHVRAWMRPLRA